MKYELPTDTSPEEIFGFLRLARSRFYVTPFVNGVLAEHGLKLAKAKCHKESPTPFIFMIVDGVSLCPVSIAETKADAIAEGRKAILLPDFQSRISKYRELDKEFADRTSWVFEPRAANEEQLRKPARQHFEKKLPRRRRQIFEASKGQCHYCGVHLDLLGKWHIEHMMPRALMGSNEPSNLVASCVPCNMKKRDKTAEEFIAERNAA